MATTPLAESGGNQVNGWPTPTVWTVTSCMSCPLLMHPWRPGGATDPFIFLSSGGFEAHITLRNRCRRQLHCKCVCNLVRGTWYAHMILRCRQIPKFSCRTTAENAAVAIFPPPQPFLAHFAELVPILCAVKQI